MSILSELFSWWGGNTWGTRVTIGRQGRFVGSTTLATNITSSAQASAPSASHDAG